MARTKTSCSWQFRNQRGQGVVEAILALPVFLTLICIIFQIFFLGIAQIQLQYAAFYAARVGAVRGWDFEEMKRTAAAILCQVPGAPLFSPDQIEIERINPDQKNNNKKFSQEDLETPIKIRVQWEYPLNVPLVDIFIPKGRILSAMGRPHLRLQSSWAMKMFFSNAEGKGHEKTTLP